MEIMLKDYLKISEEDLNEYKLHLACWNGNEQPLNVYLQSWDKWVDWNEWRGGKDDFNRQYIFSLIQYHYENGKWLFGGIFEIKKRYQDWIKTSIGYKTELLDLHKDLIGRLVVDFYRYQGMRGRSFRLENYYNEMKISEVFKSPFQGVSFPGYENIDIDFSDLEQLIKIQKVDWKLLLENVKGIYLIVDKSNGKKYVGSAYGDYGLWSRWSTYINTGHGFNDELISLINAKGIEYARQNFKVSLFEHFPMKTDDNIVLKRESFWKKAMLSKGEFGYNRN